MTRQYAWRTWAAYGRHVLDARFDTPEDAGRWRRETFPGADDAPLTLVAVVGERTAPPLPSELAAAHWAWLSDDKGAARAGDDRRAA